MHLVVFLIMNHKYMGMNHFKMSELCFFKMLGADYPVRQSHT